VSAAPIAVTAAWRSVVADAGERCSCTGPCGNSHRRTDGRCPRTLSVTVRLYVAPADPSVPVSEAHRTPVGEMAAWCGGCLDDARRRNVSPAATGVPADVGELFDVTDYQAPAGPGGAS